MLTAAPAAPPVHDERHIFVALRDGHLTAVNLADGDVVWEVVHPVVGELAVGEELLYVASRDELQGLETATGRARWSIPLEAPLSAPLVWNAGWLIAALETQTLLALRAETGETIWRQHMGGGLHVTPSLAGDRMYVSLDGGGVLALSIMTGAAVWEQRLDGTPNQILPLDDLFVGATDNHFYRLSRLDGSIKWRSRTGGDIVGLPAVDETRVYFSSWTHVVRAEPQERRTAVAPTARGPAHRGAQPHRRPVGAWGDEPAPPLLRPGHGGVLWPHPGALRAGLSAPQSLDRGRRAAAGHRHGRRAAQGAAPRSRPGAARSRGHRDSG